MWFIGVCVVVHWSVNFRVNVQTNILTPWKGVRIDSLFVRLFGCILKWKGWSKWHDTMACAVLPAAVQETLPGAPTMWSQELTLMYSVSRVPVTICWPLPTYSINKLVSADSYPLKLDMLCEVWDGLLGTNSLWVRLLEVTHSVDMILDDKGLFRGLGLAVFHNSNINTSIIKAYLMLNI